MRTILITCLLFFLAAALNAAPPVYTEHSIRSTWITEADVLLATAADGSYVGKVKNYSGAVETRPLYSVPYYVKPFLASKVGKVIRIQAEPLYRETNTGLKNGYKLFYAHPHPAGDLTDPPNEFYGSSWTTTFVEIDVEVGTDGSGQFTGSYTLSGATVTKPLFIGDFSTGVTDFLAAHEGETVRVLAQVKFKATGSPDFIVAGYVVHQAKETP